MSNHTEGTSFHIVAGWTDDIDVDLKDDDAVPSGTLAGTVTLILKDAAGNQIDFTGDVAIQDAALWRVRVTPDAADFAEGIYYGRFKVTDSGGKIAYFPNGRYDRWIVHPEA
jgi:hypothetical protein